MELKHSRETSDLPREKSWKVGEGEAVAVQESLFEESANMTVMHVEVYGASLVGCGTVNQWVLLVFCG